MAADVTFTALQKPRYTSTSTVFYAPRTTDLSSRGATPVAQDEARDQAVDTQVEVIKSPLIAEAVINQLHLDKDPTYAAKNDTEKTLPPELQRDALIDRVSRFLKVKRVQQTLLIGISYSSPSPTRAAEIANAFSAAYIAHDLQDKLTGARDTNVLLHSQIDEMRKKVEDAESASQQYKASNGLLGADAQSTTTAQQNITLLNQQYISAKAEESQARSKLEAAKARLESGSIDESDSAGARSETLASLRIKRAELSSAAAEMQQRYGPLHPELLKAQVQLKDIDMQIRIEVERVLSHMAADVDAAKSRREALELALVDARTKLAAGANATVKANELERDAEANRKLYENVLAKVQETSAAQAVSQADSHVDTPATPSSQPSFPNWPLFILLGLVLGLGLGALAAFIRETWNAELSNLEDVEGMLGLPYLGSIPTLASAIDKPATRIPTDAVCAHPLSSFAESFRGLAASILHGEGDNAVKVIGITSAIPGEGKTVTTVSLARVQALSGVKVILLDCDLRRRTANSMLVGEVDTGLVEVIEGKAKLADVVRRDDKSNADFIPLAKHSHLAKSPFSIPAFDRLLEELRASYDLVILDTPPLLPVVDTRILAQKVDALAVLVKWRSTPIGAVRTAIHHLDSVNAPITGIVLTQVNLKAQAYSGYSYSGYYNREFKSYYHSAS